VDLRQLEYFVAVAEEGSFTRAAGRVHVVQSALSAAVAALERDLGVRLFDRTTRRVALTDAGVVLLGHARSLADAVQGARDEVAEVAGGTRGTVRIGLMHALTSPALAEALALFRRERPLVRLRPQTHPAGSAGLVRAVIDDELDLAVAAVPPELAGRVHVKPLTSELMTLVCPPEHPLTRSPRVLIPDLADEVFIDVPAGWGSRASVDRLFAEHRVPRMVDIEVGDVATVVGLVRAGLGLAFIAPSSAPPLDGLACLHPVPAPIFDIGLVLPKDRLRPAAAALVATITSTAA